MRNAAGTIGETLASIVAQTESEWEAVVVDDGSEDESLALAREWARRDPRIRVLTHAGGAHRGTPATRTLTVREARGELLAFLDADDLYEPHALAAFRETMDRHEAAVAVYGFAETFGDGRPPRTIGRGDPDRPVAMLAQLAAFNVLATSATCIRARAVPESPFPDAMRLSQDWALWVEMARRGPFVFVPRTLARYRLHERSVTAQMTRNRREVRYAVDQARFLASLRATASAEERVALDAGLCVRATSAWLEAASALRHGDIGRAWQWAIGALRIAGGIGSAARALARVPAERARVRRGEDPPLLATPWRGAAQLSARGETRQPVASDPR